MSIFYTICLIFIANTFINIKQILRLNEKLGIHIKNVHAGSNHFGIFKFNSMLTQPSSMRLAKLLKFEV